MNLHTQCTNQFRFRTALQEAKRTEACQYVSTLIYPILHHSVHLYEGTAAAPVISKRQGPVLCMSFHHPGQCGVCLYKELQLTMLLVASVDQEWHVLSLLPGFTWSGVCSKVMRFNTFAIDDAAGSNTSLHVTADASGAS